MSIEDSVGLLQSPGNGRTVFVTGSSFAPRILFWCRKAKKGGRSKSHNQNGELYRNRTVQTAIKGRMSMLNSNAVQDANQFGTAQKSVK